MHAPTLATLATLAALAAAPLAAQTARADPFTRADSNGDGAISLAEVRAQKTAQFDRMDRNGDNEIDAAEMARVQRIIAIFADLAENRSAALAERIDADASGTISRAEYLGDMPLFALVDANDDGLITTDEADRMRGLLGR
jgi:Ca2+-binding EF-hand superfamily protein